MSDTRLLVEFILERLADGWSEVDLLESYQALNKDSLKAVFAYGASLRKGVP